MPSRELGAMRNVRGRLIGDDLLFLMIGFRIRGAFAVFRLFEVMDFVDGCVLDFEWCLFEL